MRVTCAQTVASHRFTKLYGFDSNSLVSRGVQCNVATSIQPVTATLDQHDPADVLGAYWHALNSLDADLVADQFTRDGSFRIGDYQRVQGRVAIRRGFVQLFAELAALEYQPITVWTCDGLVIVDADVRFVFENGGHTMVPITTLLWTQGREIQSCRLLLNSDPVLVRATRGFGHGAMVGALSS